MRIENFTLQWCQGKEYHLGEPTLLQPGIYQIPVVINRWQSPLYIESNLKLRTREIWWSTPIANICIGELPYGPTTDTIANFFKGYTRRQALDEEVIDNWYVPRLASVPYK